MSGVTYIHVIYYYSSPQNVYQAVFHSSVNNLCEVLKATADVQVKCEELGIALGLDRTVLSTISQNNLSIVQRHYEILKYWIKNGEASWKKLLFALRSPLLEEKEVAQEIVKKHLGKCLAL